MPDHDLIKRFEGWSLPPYLCPAGVPTIGWGSTRYEDGTPVKMTDQPISAARADQLLELEVLRARVKIRTKAPGLAVNRGEALESFSYNLGLAALFGSTLFRQFKAGRHEAAAKQFGRWVYAGGRRLRGLVLRRTAEKNRFSGNG